MKSIDELLRNLARAEVLEFGLVTNRLPSVNIRGNFEPVDDEAPSTEAILEMLSAVGGGRHLDTLSEAPVQWTARVEGLGVVAVAAIMRMDVVQARFTLVRRDPVRPSVPPPSAPPPSVRGAKTAPPVPKAPAAPEQASPNPTPRAPGPRPPVFDDDEPTVQTVSPPVS
jgi:twitching motility protein PilT